MPAVAGFQANQKVQPIGGNPSYFGAPNHESLNPASNDANDWAVGMQIAAQKRLAEEAARNAQLNNIVPPGTNISIDANQLRSRQYKAKPSYITTPAQSAEFLQKGYIGEKPSSLPDRPQIFQNLKEQITLHKGSEAYTDKMASIRQNIKQIASKRNQAQNAEERPSRHVVEVTEQVRADKRLQDALSPHRMLSHIINVGRGAAKYLKPNEAVYAAWATDRMRKAQEAKSSPMPRGKRASGPSLGVAKKAAQDFQPERSGTGKGAQRAG